MDLLELVAKVTLDKSEYEKGLADMRSDITKQQDKIKKNMLKVAGAGVIALSAFAVSSVKTGAEFDKAMSQVAATMGTTVDEIAELRDFALEMGKTTVFSATESADALNYMALAGYDAETSMGMLPTVLNLAASGNIDLARASDMVTDAQSALGLSIGQTEDMVDQWAKTASKSNTSVEQLGEAILTIGSTATMMAGGTDRLSTVLGILADNGIKGSEAGTHLRNMLLKLSAPTSEGAKAMEELGLEVFDSSGQMRDMQDIITDLGSALEGMSDEKKIQYISEIFNARDIGAVNALLQTSTDRWNELGGAIWDSAGAAEQMANTQLDNLAGDVTLLKSAWEGLQIEIADKLMPAARQLIQFVTKLIENFDTVGPIVAGVATAFGVLAVAINIGSIIRKVTVAFTAFNAVLAANPIGIVVALIAGAVTALVLLWKNNETFRNNVIAAWDAIKAAASKLADGIKDAFEKVKSVVTKTLDTVKSVVDSRLSNIKSAFEKNGGGIKGVVAAAWTGIKQYYTDGFNIINSLTNGKLGELTGKFAGMLANVVSSVQNSIERIKGMFNFSWSLPHIKLPHFKVQGGKAPYGLGGQGYLPSIRVDWYKKAYDTPYMFTKPTVMQGFGDGIGDEIVYGRNNLMEDIRNAVSSERPSMEVTINVYAQPNQDVNELAEKIQNRLVALDKQRKAAFA